MVGIHRDNDRNDESDVVLRALIEFLRERHNVHAVLAESRTDGRRRGGLACRNLELDQAYYLLSHFNLHLQNNVVDGDPICCFSDLPQRTDVLSL